jgi:tetratricopeptide (TPR) repeat protein
VVIPPVDALSIDTDVVLCAQPSTTVQPRGDVPRSARDRIQAFMVRPLGRVVAAVATVASIYGGYVLVWPKPPVQLEGDLNIAVARFDGTGAHRSSGGLEFSFFRALERDLSHRRGTLEIEVGSPDDMGGIGEEPAAFASRARQLAADHNADMVVYGVLDTDDVESTFRPQFFLAPERLRGAEELAGPYALGAPIRVEGDAVENPVARAAMRIGLTARASALTELLIGLGYNEIRRRRQAIEHFKAASESVAWDRRGRALLFQLIGNSRGAQGNLRSAVQNYRSALQVQPGYARALFGLAEVEYQRARGDCSRATARPRRLARASKAYAAVSSAPLQPALPLARRVLATKVALGIARIDFCAGRAGITGRLGDAQSGLESIIDDGSSVPELREQVAQAYAYLGYIALSQRRPGNEQAPLRAARNHFAHAAELARQPQRRADSLASLAFVLTRLGDRPGAARAYEDAAHYEHQAKRRSRLLHKARKLRTA